MAATVTVEERDLGWERIRRELKKFEGVYTKVGFFGSGGTPETDIAARAAVNEYGARIRVTPKMRAWWLYAFKQVLKKRIIRIPKRPFMRMTFEKHIKKTKRWLEDEYNRVLDGKQSAKKAIGKIGEHWQGFIVATIRSGQFTPNSPATVWKKKSSKPLMDTGVMRNSVRHRENI